MLARTPSIPCDINKFEQIWLGCTLGYVAAVPMRPELFDPAPQGVGGWAFAIALTLAVAAITLYFVFQAARRRQNWARWVLLILFATTLPMVVYQALGYYAAHPFGTLFDLLVVAMEGSALLLVFGPEAKEWFRDSVRA
jgi:hypothetical protein